MTAQKPLTILLVEDSTEDRAVYRHYLRRNTTTVYTCIEAITGSEGIRLWQTAQPACIVLDFGLPDMTGLEFLHAMQATNGALVTPVVMLTGQGNEQLAVQALQQGAQDYLVKGQLSAETLQHAITTACETVRLRQELATHQESLHRLNATLEQRVMERTALLDLMQDITRAANEAASSTEVLLYALERICAYLRWPVGHVYLAVTPDGTRWAPTSTWYLEAPERFTTFQQATQAVEFADGEDLIGQVGAMGKPVWSAEVTADPVSHRQSAAHQAGLTAGFAIPLLVGSEVVGVLEFYGAERLTPDRALLEAMAQIGTQLGRAIERERAAEQAQRQQVALFQREKLAAMGALLANVAHELNNPLAVILLQAELLQEDIASELLAGPLTEITQAATRCERLVRQFLTLARQHAPERTAVGLNTLLNDTLELLASAFRVDTVNVDLRLATDLPPLWADQHQLQQVLVNLLTNSLQALRDLPPPRQITLTTSWDQARAQVTLELADNGPGMSSEVRARIFEPFFTTKLPSVGTGLGLPLCLGIIEGHGGTLQVRSVPGQGTTFWIVLPMTAVPKTSLAGSDLEGPLSTRGRAILLVDDEPSIIKALTRLLHRDGHAVDTASNGREALNRLQNRTYDVILSDLRMPELDGPGLYRALQQHYPPLCRRIIILTGDTLNAETQTFFAQTGVARLTKPFSAVGVRHAIQKLLSAG